LLELYESVPGWEVFHVKVRGPIVTGWGVGGVGGGGGGGTEEVVRIRQWHPATRVGSNFFIEKEKWGAIGETGRVKNVKVEKPVSSETSWRYQKG